MKKIINQSTGLRWNILFWFLLLEVSLALLIIANIHGQNAQDFVYLARSFLQHKLYFMQEYGSQPGGWDDTAFFQNHYYWPLGPLPAVLLIPFVSLYYSPFFQYQGLLTICFNILNFVLLYKIAKRITGSSLSSLWLSWGYIFSSAYVLIVINHQSWFFAQVIATSFILLSLYEYFYHKRWFLIGIYLALAIATRNNLILAVVFFCLIIWLAKGTIKSKILNLIHMFIPIALSVILLLIYNFLRFSNIFDNGYAHQIIHGVLLQNRQYGLWSFIHFPANFYYLFLKGPEAVFLPGTKILTPPYLVSSYFGMSIFLTSPMFLWIIEAPWKKITVKAAGITVLVMLFFVLGFYSRGGYLQYGYRLALDFYPFLFVIVSFALKNKIPIYLKIIMLLSFIFNLYFIYYLFFHIAKQTASLLQS